MRRPLPAADRGAGELAHFARRAAGASGVRRRACIRGNERRNLMHYTDIYFYRLHNKMSARNVAKHGYFSCHEMSKILLRLCQHGRETGRSPSIC